VVSVPATRQRLGFEFLATLQDAFSPPAVYIVRRDVAKGLVVPLGVTPGDEPGDLNLQFTRCLPAIEVVSAREFHERGNVPTKRRRTSPATSTGR
jgi:hypothetical protein